MTRWADEDPDAMRRLLADAALRLRLLEALDAVVPNDQANGEESQAGAAG